MYVGILYLLNKNVKLEFQCSTGKFTIIYLIFILIKCQGFFCVGASKSIGINTFKSELLVEKKSLLLSPALDKAYNLVKPAREANN